MDGWSPPGELPGELVDDVRPRVQVSSPLYAGTSRYGSSGSSSGNSGSSGSSSLVEPLPVKLGQRVSHPSFGEGSVVSAEGSGATRGCR